MICRIGAPKSISNRLRPGISRRRESRPSLLQNGGVDVGDVVPVFDGVETDLVGGAVNDTPLDAAAGHPHGESIDVVVAPVAGLRAGRATELGGKQHERRVEQPALFEVF